MTAPRPDDAEAFWRQLDAQADLLAPALRKSFLTAIVKARLHVSIGALTKALAAQDIGGIVQLLLGTTPGPLWDELRAGMALALTRSLSWWDAQLAIDGVRTLNIGLGLVNPRALAAMRGNQLELVRAISQTTRDGLREYLQAMLASGENPTSLVPQLVGYMQADGTRVGGILGLTPRQARAVANYRRELEKGLSGALERALRDHRFDASVAEHIGGGTQLSQDRIDELVRRYESRYLQYRAQTIARTESLRALATGQQALWNQTIESGGMEKSRLVKRWVTAEDERVRPEHVAMHNTIIAYDDEFVLPDGRTTWGPPMDPNCRCLNWIRPTIRRVV
ncbi:MAG TPA: phage minor head protein [Gemmatimonadales bacterium]|nr:phage minor head protein [Gemmatimonadales bacterium]